MNLTDTQRELFDLLNTLSFQTGHFILSSGKEASYYMDGRKTTLSAKGSALIGALLYERIAPLGIDAIGGMTMGADPIVSAVTVVSAQQGNPIDGFLIRKEPKGHGTQQQIEGPLKSKARVVLAEDVVTTGGSLVKAIEAVQRFSKDVEIVKCITLVDRQEGAAAKLAPLGIAYESVFEIASFLSAASA